MRQVNARRSRARATVRAVERKHQLPGPDGEPIDAVEVGFRSSGEHFNDYLLDDGTVVRLKAVVTNVSRLEGLFDAEGQPIYAIKSTNVVSTSAPEDMRRGDKS